MKQFVQYLPPTTLSMIIFFPKCRYLATTLEACHVFIVNFRLTPMHLLQNSPFHKTSDWVHTYTSPIPQYPPEIVLDLLQ